MLASYNQYEYSSTAFLFSLVNKPGWGLVTFRPPGYQGSSSYQHAIRNYYNNYGPTFGGGHVSNYPSSNTGSYTNLGYSYNPPSGHSYSSSFTQSFLAGSYKFQPDEVEVFYETT